MKKIFISADIEGTTGICNWADTHKGQEDYDYFRQQMTREVTAACEGATLGGADEILVKDSHGDGCNIITWDLPEDVKIIRGWGSSPMNMMYGLDETFDGVIFTGYHIGAQNPENPLSHTTNKQNNYVKINGCTIGEPYINMLTALLFKVPVIMVTGDTGICKFFKELNPNIETVAVNEGSGSIGCISIHPKKAIRLIKEAAERAVKKDPKSMLIEMPKHFSVEISFKELSRAKSSSFYPGATLLDPRTVGFETDDFYEVIRFNHFALESIMAQAIKLPSL